jgi:hypothetical protein
MSTPKTKRGVKNADRITMPSRARFNRLVAGRPGDGIADQRADDHGF